jgi:hypothetical protein
MGQAALKSLGDQRKRLKSARRKVWEVANVLGISTSLLKMISTKERGNAWLVHKAFTRAEQAPSEIQTI